MNKCFSYANKFFFEVNKQRIITLDGIIVRIIKYRYSSAIYT